MSNVTAINAPKVSVLMKDAPLGSCTSCGAQIILYPGKGTLCHHCGDDASWQLLASTGLAANQVIINGDLYRIGDEPKHGTPRKYLGYDGQEKRIQRGDELIVTHNLWLTGSVPWKYRTALPDNARFVREGGEL